MFRTTSAIPGRIRLAIAKDFRNPALLEEIAGLAAGLTGVEEASIVLDALSIVVRYPVLERPLEEMVRELETVARDVLTRSFSAVPSDRRAGLAPGRPAAIREAATDVNPDAPPNAAVRNSATHPVELATATPVSAGRPQVGNTNNKARTVTGADPVPLPPKRQMPDHARFHLHVKHFFPGRIRLHVARLRKNSHLASAFAQRLLQVPGVKRVEASPDSGFVIVHYDTAAHKSAGLLATIRRALVGALHGLAGSEQNPRITASATQERGSDLIQEPKPGLNPLLFPTLAIATAATGGLPMAGIMGTLAMASIPTGAGALEGMRQRRFNVAQLDFAALIALGMLGEFVTGGIMTWLIGLGELIRMRTMRRSRRAISELMSPAGQTAWVERDGTILAMPVDHLKAGDIVHAYPGDQIPVDGVILDGRMLVDQKLLTGESVPVAKEAGDPVFALTLVADGQARIRVEHIGAETRAGRVVEMIENAPLSDTRVSNFAALVGDRLVPSIFTLAGGVFFFTGDLARMASILILDFVTGIRVSAPTTILSAMTGAAKQGVFIKGGKAMEHLAQVDAIVFDKTGTLTHGSPFVTEILPTDAALSADEVLRLAAAAEANLKHPAAKAIVDAALARGLDIPPLESMEYEMGLGVSSAVEGRTLNVGSCRYMAELGVDISLAMPLVEKSLAAANSLIFCAMDRRLIGLIAYSDPPRPESVEVIQALRNRGVKRIVMLTGDNRRTADVVAAKLGITDIIADAFPEQKADVVEALRAEGYTVAVIGDGINDSPAFTRANVSISLQHGADVAKETADVILLDGSLSGLPRAIDLSRDAIAILKQNVNIIIAPTVAGMAAAAVGLSNPLISTLINNGTTVVTGVNALRPMLPKPSRHEPESPPLPLPAAAPTPASPVTRS